MALLDNAWYVSSVGFTAVTQWVKNTSFSAGALCRQTAPAVGSERVFVAVVGGKTVNSSEPTLTATRGAKTVDGTVTWQECTGIAALNGDLTNTPTWSTLTGNAAFAVTLGQVIKRNNGASIWICSTAGTSGTTEPAWPDDNAGSTRTDGGGTLVWTCLGASYGVLAAPHARFENALVATWGAAGNTFFLADNHTQTQATALTLLLPATQGAPNNVVSFDHLVGSTPPTAFTAGAALAVSGNVGILWKGWGTVEGITCNGGTTSGTSAGLALAEVQSNKLKYRNCTFVLRNSSATGIYLGMSTAAASGEVQCESCAFTFGSSASQTIFIDGRAIIRNCTFGWTTKPNSLFAITQTNKPFDLLIEGCDLSNYDGTLLAWGALLGLGNCVLKDCKTHASLTLSATPNSSPNFGPDVIRSDSGNTVYKIARKRYEGDLTVDTTTVRMGGATDLVTPHSWKIVNNAAGSGPTLAVPFDLPPITIWNSITSGNINITLYGAGATTPNIDDLWYEVVYLGDASYPLGIFATAGKTSVAGTTSAWSTDSTSSWGGSPAAKWYLTKQIAPRQIGYIYIYLRSAKAGATYYVDPRPVIDIGPAVSRSSLGYNELFAGIPRSHCGIGA